MAIIAAGLNVENTSSSFCLRVVAISVEEIRPVGQDLLKVK
jgi:hypothetical protein